MPHPTPHPVRLADEITRRLGQLTDHLARLPPHEATHVIARVLDPDAGVLGGVTGLVTTSSRFAKVQAERGALPAEVWLALGRAANELDAMGGDLDEHRETLRRVSRQTATSMSKPPSPAPLVARRRR
ncbi:MAG TPA: hypothetical protein VFX60_09345 [Micromonospora sp.]|jgi:hypothetical protein|uniref:hypothetical protein n=1 Tax=Streptomyces kebangsaanensis TaxID=864058 RepID=UPI00093B6A56|nr:hypothetical protein [Streptomyces kebangsaanensis]HEX5541753.1 hypothetical protein [Micromonospora sp.]